MGSIVKILQLLKQYSSMILVIGVALLSFLYLRECEKSEKYENEVIEAKEIANSNMKALQDSGVVLQTTRDELAFYDAELAKIRRINDSLRDIKSKEVIIVKIKEKMPDITVNNNLAYNDTADLYELSFDASDTLKEITGISRFGLDTTDFNLYPSTTTITNFRLKYGFSISKYEDADGLTKLSVDPYFLDDNGYFTNTMVPKEYLDINFRGVELLNEPFKLNEPENNKPKNRWALTVSPISAGLFYVPSLSQAHFGIGPSAGISYTFSW